MPFLAGILLVPIVISAINSRPTQAESLLYKTTCGVVGLLGVQCQTASTPAAQQATSSGSGSTSTKSTSTTPATTNQSSPQSASSPVSTGSTATFAPLVDSTQQLPTITPVDSEASATAITPDAENDTVSPAITNEIGDVAFLGTSTQAPLRPSTQGWTIFGVAWYWWLLPIAALAVLARRIGSVARLLVKW